MKAVLCQAYGPPESLVFVETATPEPGPGEVVVTMKAASVNYPDVLIIENKYQTKPPLPFSPGSELAGVVKAVGDGVRTVSPGDKVIAFTTYGAFAEEVRTTAARVVPMPDGMTFPTAASFILTYGTSYHALADRGALVAGETLLVLGAAGGVGLAAIEIGKALGARVIAAASSDEKLAVCRAHRADETINYATTNLRDEIKRLTDGRGVDVVYDPVGGGYTEAAVRGLAWRGRLLVVGFAAGEIPRLPLNLPLLKGASIVGVFWGEFAKREPEPLRRAVETLSAWYQQGLLQPHVSRLLPLERAAEGIAALASRSVHGKIVLVANGESAVALSGA
jgi:NADPH2:quinone reductase